MYARKIAPVWDIFLHVKMLINLSGFFYSQWAGVAVQRPFDLLQGRTLISFVPPLQLPCLSLETLKGSLCSGYTEARSRLLDTCSTAPDWKLQKNCRHGSGVMPVVGRKLKGTFLDYYILTCFSPYSSLFSVQTNCFFKFPSKFWCKQAGIEQALSRH